MPNVRFLTGGDVAAHREVPAGMFGEITAQFRKADISFVNLEGPLSDKGERVRGKTICFRGTPASIKGVAEAGISCVNLANNHMLDFGDAALLDTIDRLDQRGIGHFGAGQTIEAARQPFILERQGLRLGFLGYTSVLPTGHAATASSVGVNPLQVYTAYEPTTNPLEYPGVAPRIVTSTDRSHLKRLQDDIAALSKRVHAVIVYVHWGSSMSPHVHDFQREIGKAAIDAGAHAVFGGHNHVLSAIEFYANRPIVYCSGNLLFDHPVSFFTEETRKTFLFGATIHADGLRDCYLLPAKSGVDAPPRLLPSRDPLWKEIVADLQKLCRDFGTQLMARDDAVEVRPA